MKRTASSLKKAVTPWTCPDCRTRAPAPLLVACALLLLSAAPLRVWGDTIEMQNGDRYAGQVVSLNTNTVVLQSDVLGTVRLPRAKVAVITLGAVPASNSPALPSPTNAPPHTPTKALANAAPKPSPAFAQLGANSNLIQQVQKQFLGDAGPEANQKFNDLLGGLMSGKLSVEDIRAEAKTAADQLRTLKREGGDEAGFATDSYLAILDHFLKETAPSGTATNAPGTSPKSKTGAASPDE